MIANFEKAKYGELDTLVASHREAGDHVAGAVVLCHGFGAPGTDLAPIADEWFGSYPELKPVRFLFPAAPLELDPVYDARAWWEIDIERVQKLMETGEFRELRNSQPPRLAECRLMVQQLVEQACDQWKLLPGQVVVGGFSQGAMLTTDLVLNAPTTLGGLICWSGSLINEAQWRSQAAANQQTAVVQSHGTMDPILPFAGAEALRDLLLENGYPLEFIRFTGQHAIPPEALKAAVQLIRSVCCLEAD
ncbi:MAG: dienelactone hydrolase family protein [Mariniblastus sp.]|nr:dienelactone hydrolase family protein [Mariniblastus sp.]